MKSTGTKKTVQIKPHSLHEYLTYDVCSDVLNTALKLVRHGFRLAGFHLLELYKRR